MHREALAVLGELGCGELAADFIVLPPREMRTYTEQTDWPGFHLGTKWSVLGASGTGDVWLASLGSGECVVAFGDHSRGDRPPRAMGINPRDWVRLARVIAELEDQLASVGKQPSIAGRPLVADARKRLESISRGLSRWYPYSLGK